MSRLSRSVEKLERIRDEQEIKRLTEQFLSENRALVADVLAATGMSAAELRAELQRWFAILRSHRGAPIAEIGRLLGCDGDEFEREYNNRMWEVTR